MKIQKKDGVKFIEDALTTIAMRDDGTIIITQKNSGEVLRVFIQAEAIKKLINS